MLIEICAKHSVIDVVYFELTDINVLTLICIINIVTE